MSRKNNIGQLIRYIFNEKKQKDYAPFMMKHNLTGRDPERFIKQFQFNETLRKYKRSNQNAIIHEVLSFSIHDKEHVNRKVLQDLSKKYIELRGQQNMFALREHRDKEHVHIHVAISATEFLTGKANRMSKKQFEDFRKQLELYQRQKFPELRNSIVYTKSKEKSKDKAYQRQENKKELDMLLKCAFDTAKSKKGLEDMLNRAGHTPYYRNGILTGVSYNDNMKFRFSKLGYNVKDLDEETITEEQKQLEDIEQLRSSRDIKEHEPDYQQNDADDDMGNDIQSTDDDRER